MTATVRKNAAGPTTPAALFGPATPDERRAVYDAFAAAGPVHRIELPDGKPAWLVTGYDAVRTALDRPAPVEAPARADHRRDPAP